MQYSIFNTNRDFQSALLLAILEESADFFAVMEKENRKILFINRHGIDLFEMDNEEQLADKKKDYSILKYPPADIPLFHSEIDNAIKEKGFWQKEQEYVTQFGKTFWGVCREVLFQHNEKEYYLMHIFNNSANHQHEEKFKLQNDRFEALFNHASMSILATDSKGSIIMANQHLLNQFGYENDTELKGQKVEILIPSDLRKKHEAHRDHYNINPKKRFMGYGLDLLALRKDGSRFPVEISLGYYKMEAEQFVFAFVNDITKRVEYENHIKQLNAELEEKIEIRTAELKETVEKLGIQIKETETAEAELVQLFAFQKAILDNAAALIIATDKDGFIKLINPEVERLLGYRSDEVIGKYKPTLFHDKDETEHRARQFSKELNKEIEAGFETYVAKTRISLLNEHEWIYISKAGKKIPVWLAVSAMNDSDGNIIGFLGIANDITERKKAEQELQKSLEKEMELNELKSRFVSMASHEFRTPLSTVLSSAYLLSKYTTTEDQEKRTKHIDRIISSVTTLTDTLNDFLSVGKIEEGKIQVRWKEFDIKEHLTSIISDLRPVLRNGQNITYTHIGATTVTLDLSLLKHIAMNLVSNSIKFSGANALIKVHSEVLDDSIEFSVKDNGLGISHEDQGHLFERFFRGTNVANIQGTGLGLHIVKKYAELMNGSIHLESELNKGTAIIVTFKMMQHDEIF